MKSRLGFIIILICLSCNNGPVQDNGVNIDYTDSKNGDTTLLFIHGWGINKTYWTNQATYFSKNYRVVTIDLPGFGNSGKNRKSWTTNDYANDISAVITQLNLKNVILVGHSMSGAIAVEAALNNPSKVMAIIGIDNFKNFGEPETPQSKEETENFFKIARTNFKATISEYVNQALFSPTTDSTVRKRVLDDILHSDTLIALECLQQGGTSDEKVISLQKTLYLINSDVTPTDTIAFIKNKINYRLFLIHGTGHYPMIEKPNDFNLLLEQAIKTISGSKKS